MKRLLLALLCLILPLAADAQTRVYPSQGKASAVILSDKPVGWLVVGRDFQPLPVVVPDADKDGNGRICIIEVDNDKAGTYGAMMFTPGKAVPDIVSVTLNPTPGPGPIIRPLPPPPVDPLDPPPPPPVKPVPLAGMRVLVIYEQSKSYPKAVADALNSKAVRDYLDTKCLKHNGWPEHRFLDDDPSFAASRPEWQALRSKLPANLESGPDGYPIPAVAIGDSLGTVVNAGPYPTTEAAALEFFKRFGGN